MSAGPPLIAGPHSAPSAAAKGKSRQPAKPRRSHLLILAAILFVALLPRIPYLGTERLWPDEALYARIARGFVADPASLLRREAYLEHLPIVPVILSLGLFFSNSLAGLRLVTLAVNLLGIFATYRLGERIGGPFAGLCAALFLTLNIGYLHHSHLILIDGAFAVAHAGLALALLGVKDQPGWDRHDLLVGVAAVGLAAIKWYAALMVLPIVALYYLAAGGRLAVTGRLQKVLLPVLCLALFAVPYLIWKAEVLREQGGVAAYFQRPALYYLATAPGFVGGWLALSLVLVGGYFLFRQPARVRALLGAFLVVELVAMSLAPEKDGRYILPTLPFLAVLYALGCGGLLERVAKRAPRGRAQLAAIGILSLQIIPFFVQQGRTHLTSTYTGFLEAGDAVRTLAGPDALILAGSVRAMKYAAGRGLEDRIQALPGSVDDLRSVLRGHRGRVVLETDRWEYTQPAWIYPWSEAKGESLRSAGFRQAVLVRRSVGGHVEPVVVVMTRD